MAYFPKKILVGITGRNVKELKNKIIEADKFGIKEVSLFLTFLSPSEKKQIYDFLLKSKIKRIPLVHLRDDMKKEELIFLKKNFKTKYFNMHVNHFKYLKNFVCKLLRLYWHLLELLPLLSIFLFEIRPILF